MKSFKVLLIMLSVCVLCSGCFDVGNEENNEIDAYKDLLIKYPAKELDDEELNDLSWGYDDDFKKYGNHFDKYSIIDVNKDDVPELITFTTINNKWNIINIYTYKDGKTILMKNPLDENDKSSINQSSVANGWYDTYICEDNHIHSIWKGTNPLGDNVEENTAFIIKNDQLFIIECDKNNKNNISFEDILMENNKENVDKISK